ncbi:MAG: head-tail adaptor protein [Paracoccaceae bacterium]|jgi:hypothetical protein|nr:head-tail adaptor protein [Paracoccaceae bacterium]WQC62120.1 head-tail adaptor protein [Alphaproteobacteria bacterium US3C007]
MRNKIPKLSHLLTLEDCVSLADGAGGSQKKWQKLGTLWARLEVSSHPRSASQGGILRRINWQITLRALPPSAKLYPHPGRRFRLKDALYPIYTTVPYDASGKYLLSTSLTWVAE